MDSFLRVTAGILVAVVLIITLRRQNSEISLVITLLVCCMVASVTAGFLDPVIRFLKRLQTLGAIDKNILQTLLKIIGICFLTEITELVCKDSSNESLGKVLQILGSGLILYLSLPMFTKLLDIVEKILENL